MDDGGMGEGRTYFFDTIIRGREYKKITGEKSGVKMRRSVGGRHNSGN